MVSARLYRMKYEEKLNNDVMKNSVFAGFFFWTALTNPENKSAFYNSKCKENISKNGGNDDGQNNRAI